MIKTNFLILIATFLISQGNSAEWSQELQTTYQKYDACIGTFCEPKGTSCHKAFGLSAWNYSKDQVVKSSSHRCKLEDGTYGESSLCCEKGSPEAEWLKKAGAKPNEFPFVVYTLADYRPKIQKLFSCTGTIYNKDYILTAAHCVVDQDTGIVASKVTVTLGANHMLTDQDEERVYTASGNHVMRHSGYNTSSLDNDIALLKLDKPIKSFDKYIQPLRLGNSNDDYLVSKIGIPLGYGKGPFGYSTDSIWGHPLKLTKAGQTTQMRSSTVRNCNGLIREPDQYNKRICVGGYGKSGVGTGHSGGPLVCLDKSGSPYQCGISSYSNQICSIATSSCADRFDMPSVYTDVTAYNSWISKKTKNAVQKSSENLKQLKYPYVEGQDWSKRQ